MIADPAHLLHCCIRSDGGGAVVLTTEERAQGSRQEAPYGCSALGEATSHTTMSEWEDFTESPAARSGPLAFERAGVTPDEIDTCQLYDAFTSMVLQTFEGLGFCKKGEGGPFVADGRMRLDGALPTNTDGGGLSHCHLRHAQAMFRCSSRPHLDSWQGEAEGLPVQVENAKLACVSGTGGWFSSASTVILGVE